MQDKPMKDGIVVRLYRQRNGGKEVFLDDECIYVGVFL